MIEYFKDVMDIHGEHCFGVHEAIFNQDTQTHELRCWGCNGKGYNEWKDNWKEHFTHEYDCQYIKLKELLK